MKQKTTETQQKNGKRGYPFHFAYDRVEYDVLRVRTESAFAGLEDAVEKNMETSVVIIEEEDSMEEMDLMDMGKK